MKARTPQNPLIREKAMAAFDKTVEKMRKRVMAKLPDKKSDVRRHVLSTMLSTLTPAKPAKAKPAGRSARG